MLLNKNKYKKKQKIDFLAHEKSIAEKLHSYFVWKCQNLAINKVCRYKFGYDNSAQVSNKKNLDTTWYNPIKNKTNLSENQHSATL